MLRNLKYKVKQNLEIFLLILLVSITIISTSYYNFTKNKLNNKYNELIDNVYFQKTLNHIVGNLDPKYKKIKHKIQSEKLLTKF